MNITNYKLGPQNSKNNSLKECIIEELKVGFNARCYSQRCRTCIELIISKMKEATMQIALQQQKKNDVLDFFFSKIESDRFKNFCKIDSKDPFSKQAEIYTKNHKQDKEKEWILENTRERIHQDIERLFYIVDCNDTLTNLYENKEDQNEMRTAIYTRLNDVMLIIVKNLSAPQPLK